MQFLQDLMPSLRLSRLAPSALRKHLFGEETETLASLCRMMMDSDGEYSSLLLAERILNAYELLDDDGRMDFFQMLHADYNIDLQTVRSAIDNYEENQDAGHLLQVTRAAEPLRRELLRRINLAPQGTARLVKMREHLLNAARQHPELKCIDIDFHHLFSSWFNRGFLLMEPLDWTTPAHILEKIIAYEAVHQIENWAELRRRLEPADRYCYGFFHPSMEDEPLVFVEVALTDEVPRGIGEILQRDADTAPPDNPSCAIFYSISNCHKGLAGISFGNFLIKQVATSLKLRFPQLKNFTTISPSPGFRAWLDSQAEDNHSIAELLPAIDLDMGEATRVALEKQVATYYLEAKNAQGEPLDAVARFHLKNGAILDRINILANPSEAAMQTAYGTMVNYVYDLSRVEDNHEAYVHNGEVVASSAVKKALSR